MIIDPLDTLDSVESAIAARAVFAHPRAIRQAHAAGFDAAEIQSDDFRAIFIAADVANGSPLQSLLQLAARVTGWAWEDLCQWAESGMGLDIARIIEAHRVLCGAIEAGIEAELPLYVPPVALGKCRPLRIALALRQLARFVGMPANWIHAEFALACDRIDARKQFKMRGKAA